MANEEKISEYVDRAGVTSDTKFIVDHLNQVMASYQKLSSIRVGLNGVESLGKVIPATKEASEVVTEYDNSLKRVTERIASMNGHSKEFTQVLLADAKAAKELSAAKLNEAKAREVNERAAQREADAIEKSNKAQQSKKAPIVTENVPTVIASDDDVDYDAIDKRNEALRQQAIAEAEAAGSTGVYTESQHSAKKATEEATDAVDEQLDPLGQNIVLRGRLQRNIKDVQADLRQDAKLLKEGSITQEEYNKRVDTASIEVHQYKTKIAELNAEIKNQTAGVEKGSEAYKKLSAQLAAAKLNAKNLAVQYGINHPLAQQAAADALHLDKQVKLIDKSVGDSQRNVGNYAEGITKGFKTAFSGLRTIANILPGIGISGLFLAAYEGITTLIGSLTGLNSKSEESAAILKKVTDELERQKAASDALAESISFLNRIGRINLEIDLGKGFELADLRGQSVGLRTVGDQIRADIAANNAAILKNTDDYYNKRLLTEKDYDTAHEALLKNGAELIKTQNKNEEDQRVIYRQIQLQKNKDQEEAAKKSKDTREKERKDALEYFKTEQEILIQRQKDIVSSSFGNERNEARKRQNALEIGLIRGISEFELEQVGITQKKKDNILLKAKDEKARANRKALLDIEAFAEQERKALYDHAQEQADFLLKQQETADQKLLDEKRKFNDDVQDLDQARLTNKFDKDNNDLDAQYVKDLKATSGDKEKRLKVERDYNAKKLKLQTDYQTAALESQIAFLANQNELDRLAAERSGDKDEQRRVLKQAEAIQKLRNQLNQARIEGERKTNKATEEIDQEHFDKQVKRLEAIKGIALDAANVIGGFLNSGDEKEKNRNQAKLDALEAQKQKEIEVATQSIANAEERAAAITVIEARAQSQREAIERRQRQLDERRARFEKAQNIATAIAETTIAVIRTLGAKPWTPANIAMAVAVGAIGAARIAAMIATPIPKYKMGTKDHPGGLAEVGHGKSELVQEPDGTMYVTPSSPTTLDLPKHTIVHPDASLALKMNLAGLKKISERGGVVKGSGVDISGVTKGIARMEKSVVNAIKNKREHNILVEKPIKSWIKSGDTITEFIKKNF